MSRQIAVVGSGLAAVTFAEELRKLEPDSLLTLLTRETFGYYSRPLLSHGFTRDDIETKIVLKPFAALAANRIAVESGVEVLAADAAAKTLRYARDGAEQVLGYDVLVLATGSDALIPPPFRAQSHLYSVLNSLADLVALRRRRADIQALGQRPRWAVVGGGLIGCEVSADLAKAGDAVMLFHALPRLMERQLVEADSARLLEVMRASLGVDVRLDSAVQGFAGGGFDLAVELGDGTQSDFHGIILACGFKPRTQLAESAGLAIRRGIAVDGFLATGDPAIFAVGDCAELPDGRLYAYVTPVRSQALWLAQYLAGQTQEPWAAPAFKPKAKVPGFEAQQPYLF